MVCAISLPICLKRNGFFLPPPQFALLNPKRVIIDVLQVRQGLLVPVSMVGGPCGITPSPRQGILALFKERLSRESYDTGMMQIHSTGTTAASHSSHTPPTTNLDAQFV